MKIRKWLLWVIGLYAGYYLFFLTLVHLFPTASTRWEENDWIYTPLSRIEYLDVLAGSLEQDLLGGKCEDKFVLVYTNPFSFVPVGVQDLYFDRKLDDFRPVKLRYSCFVSSRDRHQRLGEALERVNRIMVDDCLT